MTKRVKLTAVTTPAGTLAFSHLAKPDDKFNKDNPKYTARLILDPEESKEFFDNVRKLAFETAEKMGLVKVKPKKTVVWPWRDGDEINEEREAKEKDIFENYAGKSVLTAKSKFQPLFMIKPSDMDDEGETVPRSGDTVKLKLEVLPYEGPNGGGVSLRLKAVKLIEKGVGSDNGDFGDEDDDEYVAANAKKRGSSDASKGASADSDGDDGDDDADY